MLVFCYLSLSFSLSSRDHHKEREKEEGKEKKSVRIVPVRIYALAGGALAQLLERGGADVGQVVGARARDDGVPDDGLVGLVGRSAGDGGGGPLGGDVDEELLGVPGEERREVGVQRELDDGVLLLLRAVVVRPAFHSVCGGASGVVLLVGRIF